MIKKKSHLCQPISNYEQISIQQFFLVSHTLIMHVPNIYIERQKYSVSDLVGCITFSLFFEPFFCFIHHAMRGVTRLTLFSRLSPAFSCCSKESFLSSCLSTRLKRTTSRLSLTSLPHFPYWTLFAPKILQKPQGGGTWVFFGWVCAARDSKLAPRSRNGPIVYTPF